jgi:hypothetical protein
MGALSVWLCTDYMASCGQTQDEEYDSIEADFRECLPECTLTFRRNAYPHTLANARPDIYVFDYGGMLPGCEELVADHFRELIRQADDHPNTLFALFSRFSVRWYEEIMRDETRELGAQHNVMYAVAYWFDELRARLHDMGHLAAPPKIKGA